MDDGVAAGVDVALATAATSARFGRPSHELESLYGSATPMLAALNPGPFLAAPGGIPLVAHGRLVGALGVGGADPQACADIARQVGSG
jgi:uncharacterized protein GlcG (DUF336 family)